MSDDLKLRYSLVIEATEDPIAMFEVMAKLASLAAPERTDEVSLVVDTGATLSWIPREILERLGAIRYSRLPFTRADGRPFERAISAVVLTVDGSTSAVPVALGEPGEEAVLGMTALEGLGFKIYPDGKKLVPHKMILHQVQDVPPPPQKLQPQ